MFSGEFDDVTWSANGTNESGEQWEVHFIGSERPPVVGTPEVVRAMRDYLDCRGFVALGSGCPSVPATLAHPVAAAAALYNTRPRGSFLNIGMPVPPPLPPGAVA